MFHINFVQMAEFDWLSGQHKFPNDVEKSVSQKPEMG